MDWRLSFSLLLALSVLVHNLEGCLCLNSEGLALLRFRERIERDPYGALLDWNVDDDDPCSWFGVGCLDGKVVLLNLKDLCLEGTLTAELGTLRHIRSIILRNNSFSGIIPREVGQLKELEVLDLAYNNLSGPVPSGFGSNSSLKILTLSNNFYLDSISPELHELNMRSELYVGQNVLSDVVRKASWIGRSIMRYINGQVEDAGNRRLLQSTLAASPAAFPTPSPPSSVSQSSSSIALPPSPSGDSPVPAPSPTVDPPFPVPTKPNIAVDAPPSLSVPSPSPSISPQQSQRARSSHNFLWIVSLSIIVGVCVVFIISIFGILFWKNKKVVTVRPWTTGLSGQLQKAFVTGVPSLKRSELETACEDFSNIIGTLSDSTVYKGTLSSGVEIAVVVCALTSAKDWSKHLEEQFRKKIDTLSKVNHKNFVNLLGYCEEEQPFARMMVFEYAPNGTLFEHLHIKEAEHLDWGMRLRIAMGMAYCLEHMHQLDPPIFLKNLNSTTVYLTDDYAAKISDFSLWNKTAVLKIRSEDTVSSDSLLGAQSNVYSFGLILLEMITGKLSDSEYDGPLIELSSEHLRGLWPLREIMDPMLLSVKEDEANSLCSVILSCTNPDPTQRPTMREVTARLREITAMAPDGATPRLSPLWWAELEILSSDAS